MPNLRFRDYVTDAHAIVLDKDGTLIDFQELWGSRMVSAADAMVLACQGGNELRDNILRTVGYSLERYQTLTYGPLATAPIDQLEIVGATVLHQAGIP